MSCDLILSVARAFLERRPDESLADLLSPELEERARIIRAVPRTYKIVDYHTDVRRLTFIGCDGSVATCLCDARLRMDWLEGDRSFPFVSRQSISGQIELVNTADGWKIADYPRHGVPIRSTFRIYRGTEVSGGDFIIVPRLLELSARGPHLLLELRNESPSTAKIVRGGLRARPRIRLSTVEALIRGVAGVEAGATELFDAGWRVSSRRVPTPLSFEFVVASLVAEPLHLAFQLPGVPPLVEGAKGPRDGRLVEDSGPVARP